MEKKIKKFDGTVVNASSGDIIIFRLPEKAFYCAKNIDNSYTWYKNEEKIIREKEANNEKCIIAFANKLAKAINPVFTVKKEYSTNMLLVFKLLKSN